MSVKRQVISHADPKLDKVVNEIKAQGWKVTEHGLCPDKSGWPIVAWEVTATKGKQTFSITRGTLQAALKEVLEWITKKQTVSAA